MVALTSGGQNTNFTWSWNSWKYSQLYFLLAALIFAVHLLETVHEPVDTEVDINSPAFAVSGTSISYA